MRVFGVIICLCMVFSCGKDPVDSNTGTGGSTGSGGSTDGGTTGGGTTSTVPTIDVGGFDFTDSNEEGWTRVWEEDFDTDLSLWDTWTGGAFNNELQLYRGSNLFVENDLLYIRGLREGASGPANPFDATTKSFGYTSGRIESKEKFSPSTNGGTVRYAARILLPAGEGLWPAFWSYDDPWPTQGEIDVLEFRGHETDIFKTNFFYGNEPNQVLTNSNVQSTSIPTGVDLTAEFHVYELEWTETDLKMFFDGELVKTYNTEEFNYVDDMFDKSQNLVLNLAIGGDFFSELDPSLIPAESYMVVDWVRVYRK